MRKTIKNIEDLIDTFENTGDNGNFFIGDYSNIEIAIYIRKQQEEIERLNKELKFHKRNEKILINCQNDLTEKLEKLKTELQEEQNHIEEYLHKLKEENKQLREELNKSNKINKLERLLEEEKRKCKYAKDAYRFTAYEYILKKLQELKGSDK